MIAQRQRLLGLVAAGVILSCLLLQYFLQSPPSLAKLAAEAEWQFQKQEQLAEHWLERLDLWEAITQDGFYCEEAQIIQNAPIPLFLLQGEQLIFWNTTDLSLSAEQLVGATPVVQSLSGQSYFLMRQSWKGGIIVTAVLPLPSDSQSSGAHAIKDRAGNPVYYLDKLADQPSYANEWLLSFLLCLSILLFIFIINKLLQRLQYRIPAAAILLLAISIILIGVSYWEHSIVEMAQKNTSPLFPGLNIHFRHVVAGAILSLWGFSRWQYIWSKQFTYTAPPPFFSASLAYWSINAPIIGISFLMKFLVFNEGLDYNFDNVLQLPWLELLGLLAILIYLVTHLLYSLWVIRKVQQLSLTRQERFLSIGIGIVLALPLSFWLGLGIATFVLCLILLLFTTLLDLFVELDTASPTWLILWLSLLSAFSTGLLLRYQMEVSNNQRIAFAKQMASYRDTIAERSLDALTRKLEHAAVNDLAILAQQDPYLKKNYSFASQETDTTEQIIKPAKWIREAPNKQYISYTVDYNGQQLALQPKWKTDRRILSHLIPSAPLLQSKYNYAIRLGDEIIIRKGYLEEEWLKADNWEQGKLPEYANQDRRALVYYASDPAGYQVLVSERLGGYFKPASLFSYLFVLLTLVLLVLFVLNRRFNFFPDTSVTLFVGTPSLRHRIQLSTIGLSLAALLLAGWVTVIFIRRDSLNTQAEQLLERVDVMLRDVEGSYAKLDSSTFLSSLSAVHQVDLFSYTSGGALRATSFPYLFDKGFKAPYLAPDAFYTYQKQGIKPAILQDQAGGLNYLAAYIPLSESIDVSSRFLVVVFASGEQGLKDNAIAFIGNLLNLYVFLLLIASVSAIAVAKTITRPLLEIGEKLRRFKLGENKPLSWESEDEIGQLVMAYNAMIAELEVSTEKLKQSEREGAWREMAKQVAHEIKNPLTPMKLSIQYLQHAQQSDPEKARSLIDRVSKTMIEQIDSLAHIATAFSNFAKMPKAELTLVNLNAIINSVYQLFTEGENHQEEINLELPEQPIMVNADGKQLLRIFNNLIKNAQQAIPEEDKGFIQIHLYQEDHKAIVAIKDNGTGIPTEIQPKVFQPNFTTKSSGMGLGLAMCKNMIEAMEGQIYFETEEGKGTTFYISLPFAGSS